MLNVESLVCTGWQIDYILLWISAALWTRILHEWITSSSKSPCLTEITLQGPPPSSQWGVSLSCAEPTISQRGTSSQKFQVKESSYFWGGLRVGFWMSIMLDNRSEGTIWQCSKKEIFWENEQGAVWVCKLTATLRWRMSVVKDKVVLACSQKENWLG